MSPATVDTITADPITAPVLVGAGITRRSRH